MSPTKWADGEATEKKIDRERERERERERFKFREPSLLFEVESSLRTTSSIFFSI